jgi:hypothetical protein
MGVVLRITTPNPIPTLTLPLKGRENGYSASAA